MSRQATGSLSALAILFASVAAPAVGAPGVTTADPAAWCGTHGGGLSEATAIHRDLAARAARTRRPIERSAPMSAFRSGEIAVLLDEGQLVHQPNPYDLGAGQLTFLQKKVRKQNQIQLSYKRDSTILEPLGTRLALSDDSTIAVQFPKGFSFTFFGKKHSGAFVNSDGTLTFINPDFESTERSLARFLNGPPRIAAFFADLNPETAPDDGGVYLFTSKTRVSVTWYRVPEFGVENENTVQLSLFKDGKITLAFGDVQSASGVVGIAPGEGGPFRLLDYDVEAPLVAASPIAVGERFGTDRNLDDFAIANFFLSEFADDYDHVIVWLDFPISLGGAFAYEFTVKNEITGIGLPVFDQSRIAGSNGRLRAFVQMGSLSRYPADPSQDILGTNSTLDILGHEAGHRWLSFFNFKQDNGVRDDLLGRQRAHWSFFTDSDASVMEGNDIRDDGGGRFTTVDATKRYSLLDQYAMGLVGPADVPPTMLVTGSDATTRESPPATGLILQGQRLDVPIEAILAAEGQRLPGVGAAPTHFRMVFVIVTQNPAIPQSTIDKIDAYRRAWEPYFALLTEGRASVDTSLR